MWLPPQVVGGGEIVCLRKGVFVDVSDAVCESEESDFDEWFVYARFWSVCNFMPWTCTAHWQCVFTSPDFIKCAQSTFYTKMLLHFFFLFFSIICWEIRILLYLWFRYTNTLCYTNNINCQVIFFFFSRGCRILTCKMKLSKIK